MAPRLHRTRAGMTIIEVMLAIGIVSMMMAMLGVGFSQVARNKDRAERSIDRYHAIRSSLERLSRELASAYVSAQQNPAEALRLTKTVFIGKDRMHGDRINFASFSHRRLYRNAHESDQCELSYFLARNEADPSQYDLVRREDSVIDAEPEKGGRIQILIEDVKDFQLEYLDPQTSEWIDTWDTTQAAGQPNRLPAQVKIVLKVPEPNPPPGRTPRTLTFGTRASIPIRYGLNHSTYNP